ncbi:hypothetical protein PENNAL_c0004G08271 [Penicillium nalgiovense]|uniref:Uncharacterized protein n=1 Tax=Penicillium nalgiovense TaxID=60175 RepID=A0A1V6Z3R2_PENNA|nr:hypothetical protein PENNAL_c0004G08271 [Penicillium nalgiovense]
MSSNSGRTGRANWYSQHPVSPISFVSSQGDDCRKIIETKKYWFEPAQVSDPLARNTGIGRRKIIYLLNKVIRAVDAPDIVINRWAFDSSFS